MPWRQAGEYNEIRVDRISPQDATAIDRLGTVRLKGTAFNQFAAFLSRAYRENDYLLGRLHAIDRLIEIVCEAAPIEIQNRAAVTEIKRKAIRRVLDAEQGHLSTCKSVIVSLRTALETN
jgi:hypothetical protein